MIFVGYLNVRKFILLLLRYDVILLHHRLIKYIFGLKLPTESNKSDKTGGLVHFDGKSEENLAQFCNNLNTCNCLAFLASHYSFAVCTSTVGNGIQFTSTGLNLFSLWTALNTKGIKRGAQTLKSVTLLSLHFNMNYFC